MERIICVCVGYIFGMIQTAYIYGKFHHIDIREHGSGNAGTTNALRTLGKKAGLIVFVCDDFSEVCEILKKCSIKTYAAVVDRDAQAVDKTDFSHGVAVVIGNEGRGIPKEDVALCDSRLTIKMQGNIESLNAAMAAGIILWEMKRSD